jgi:hypothetical protein
MRRHPIEANGTAAPRRNSRSDLSIKASRVGQSKRSSSPEQSTSSFSAKLRALRPLAGSVSRLPVLVAGLCASCAQAPPSAFQGASLPRLGESKQMPIEVCMPAGQRAYLSRLVCPGGDPPSYKRVGSFGNRNDVPKKLPPNEEQALLERVMRGAPLQAGEVDYHVVDGYELSCGETRRILFLDMYHCHQLPPTVAPHGFTLRAAK